MNKRRLIFLLLYLIHLIVIFATIIWISDNRFINISLSIYLLLASSVFIYGARKRK